MAPGEINGLERARRPTTRAARRGAACAPVLLALLAVSCATPPPRRQATWSGRQTSAQGLAASADAGRARVPSERLRAATERLLLAIERETGERPVLPEDLPLEPLPATVRRELVREERGWGVERVELARAVLEALDTREATVRALSQARQALRWDLMLGARWGAVDRRLVLEALARADAALPASAEAEVVVEVPDATPGGVTVFRFEDGAPAFAWPVSPVEVTSRYGWRADPFGDGTRRHSGIDLAGLEGQLVHAVAPGVVRFAAKRGGYGLHVELVHAGGVVSRYAHLSSADVEPGQRVGGHEVIGRVGKTGRATGPHLHFELWRGGLPIDPTELLPERSRLASGDE